MGLDYDWVNGVFEGLGAFFTWKNAFTLYREKTVKGVYWPMMVFFTAWGVWNLLYYPSLKQWASFAGGVALVCGNTAWVVVLLMSYRKGWAGTGE